MIKFIKYGLNIKRIKLREKCLDLGGDLLSIHSEEEHADLERVLQNFEHEKFVIGFEYVAYPLYDYIWYDHSEVSYTNWELNEPNEPGTRRKVFINNTGVNHNLWDII